MEKAVHLLKQRRYDEALQAFLSIDVPEDQYPELSYYLGLCYTHLGKYDEALLFMEQVLNSGMSFPHIYQSRMILGYIYTVTNRFRLAEFEFSKLLDEGYESAKVYAALAYVAYQQKKTASSIACLEKALRIDPDNSTALNSLGFILADGSIKLDAALGYCKRAVAQNPQNPAYLDSLGWVYFKMGRFDEAMVCLKKAMEKSEGNEEIAHHLEQVKRARERRSGAR